MRTARRRAISATRVSDYAGTHAAVDAIHSVPMRNLVITTFLMTVLPRLLLAQQPARSKDVNFYSNTPQLQARIARFTAEPATSKSGQTVRLEWAVENRVGVSIEPGIGAVQPRGIREVNPRQSTTYVLTVQGPREQMITQDVTVTIPGTTPLKATPSVKREIPKMPDGKPNLSMANCQLPEMRWFSTC